ncbi:Zinc transporter 6 [Acorus calamus]|uniref:Zinc transporter 6 n=1 Tax=Acorus calamus TaxID=4465 RepID=A0AAV9C4X1_ACOCL|nr:Zinc transporter 6 [Acorus calamus]
MSQNVCTLRSLVAALTIHQIFGGMVVGGYIAQAGFNLGMTMSMCTMFSVTTLIGIILGKHIFYLMEYNDSRAHYRLGYSDTWCSIVTFIEVDLFHNKAISSKPWLQKASYTALVLRFASVSVLAF